MATHPPPTQDFTFETLTVDDGGAVLARATRSARRFFEDLGGGVMLPMVAIPGGAFQMGSPAGEGYADERPQHAVTIAPFFMGQGPVTQGQWQAVMGSAPACRCTGAGRPIDRVTWHAAQAFCTRLARLTGRAYRLPAEAEWEYACRAGTTAPFYTGATITTDLANYVGNHVYRAEPRGVYRHETTEPGIFPPNQFGLYDMSGNVWEWCTDAWHDDYRGAPPDGRAWAGPTAIAARVLRGGCWHDPPGLCRSAARLKFAPDEGDDFVGFRVCLSDFENEGVTAG